MNKPISAVVVVTGEGNDDSGDKKPASEKYGNDPLTIETESEIVTVRKGMAATLTCKFG